MHSFSIGLTDVVKGFARDVLKGRQILITGAGKGLGRACAVAAANCGAKVIAVARSQSDLDSLADHTDGAVEGWAMDLRSEAFIERLSSLELLHGLINNAGTNRVGLMQEQSVADLDAVLELNVRAPWLISKAALPALIRAQGASIVHMSSQMGHVGSPQRTLYCMSKHAIEGLTKAMAVELAEQQIRVNSVAPTFVLTALTAPMMEDPEFSEFVLGMIPARKLATADEVAAACIYLLSDLSNSTTGSCLKVDGGWTAR
jgi:NAD(P)-dependent dehydrogenase (short-subunit alcohol dehydrogenase family)